MNLVAPKNITHLSSACSTIQNICILTSHLVYYCIPKSCFLEKMLSSRWKYFLNFVGSNPASHYNTHYHENSKLNVLLKWLFVVFTISKQYTGTGNTHQNKYVQIKPSEDHSPLLLSLHNMNNSENMHKWPEIILFRHHKHLKKLGQWYFYLIIK